LLDALVVGCIAGDQLQAMDNDDGGDHRIGQADGLAGAFEIAPDAARCLGGSLAKFHDLFAADMGK